MADWVPLYTREGLERYLPTTLSSFVSTGAPQLTAVVPLKRCVGTDKEFLLLNFHQHGCLMRQSFNLGGRCRQLAFCPYCRVINENSDTVLSHMRKHLDLHFVCGGCYSKSFLNGPALRKAHEDSVSLRDGHQRPVQNLQEVGLLVSPLPTTQGSREWSLGTPVGLFVSPFLTTQGSWEQSLGTSVCQDADPTLEAVPLTTYLPLLTYPRSIYL